MKVIQSGFENLFVIDQFSFKDNRGEFVKTIHAETFIKEGLEYVFTESFYSISQKNVLRGMHFQAPPEDHVKLVYVLSGRILDVVVDLRKGQPTFGTYFTVELSEYNRKAIYIGKGFAHGFLALEENSIVEYHTTTSQSKECEGGILWNSFGFEWPVENPILSDRDKLFPILTTYNSPF